MFSCFHCFLYHRIKQLRLFAETPYFYYLDLRDFREVVLHNCASQERKLRSEMRETHLRAWNIFSFSNTVPCGNDTFKNGWNLWAWSCIKLFMKNLRDLCVDQDIWVVSHPRVSHSFSRKGTVASQSENQLCFSVALKIAMYLEKLSQQ